MSVTLSHINKISVCLRDRYYKLSEDWANYYGWMQISKCNMFDGNWKFSDKAHFYNMCHLKNQILLPFEQNKNKK